MATVGLTVTKKSGTTIGIEDLHMGTDETRFFVSLTCHSRDAFGFVSPLKGHGVSAVPACYSMRGRGLGVFPLPSPFSESFI